MSYYGDGEGHFHKIELDVKSLIYADFGAGSVLIAFGAILGKVNLMQLWVLATIQMVFYCLNEAILMNIFFAMDIGGSMVIHAFGAYYGLAAAFFYYPKRSIKDEDKLCGSSYTSNLVAMVGTLFLFMYWPSFNAALGSGVQQHRTIINTLFGISTSCISACLFSRIAKGKLDMEVVLNATLAGGVALGSAADVLNHAFTSMIVGYVAGAVSALGFIYLSPFLREKIGLHDTCGVHNLHGIPGILGAIVSAITCAGAGRNFDSNYASESSIFVDAQHGRTPSQQAGYQMASIGVTLGLAILGGIVGGYITTRSFFQPPTVLFHDSIHFHEAELEEEYAHLRSKSNIETVMQTDRDLVGDDKVM